MSKERLRRRAAQEAARAKPKARPAGTGSRKVAAPAVPAARSGVTRSGAAKNAAAKKQPVYRQRRFPRLPWQLKAALAVGWLLAVVAILLLVPTWTGRIGLIVIATMLLPLIVVLVRDPSRRTRR